jgi:Flp pilus assembly protein TadG
VRARQLSRHGRAPREERGAALVEFVLIVPLLLTLVMGLLSGGIVYNHKLDLVSAAREGARYGAAIPQDQCTPNSKCQNQTWAQLVQSVVVQRSDGDVNTSQVCVALVSGPTGTVVGGTSQPSFTTKTDGTSRCYNDGNGDKGIRVQVRVTRTGDSINVALFSIPVTLTSSATAKFEQQ